jgi:hypothetical protein
LKKREVEFIHKNPKSFVSAGDMGDVIYHLLYIKTLGGDKYHLDPCGVNYYLRDDYIQCGDGNTPKFNLTKALFLLPLLKEQTYLKDVDLYSGDPIDAWKHYDVHVGEFHKDDLGLQNLVFFHAKKYNLPLGVLNEPWLEVAASTKFDNSRDLVINRTLRYRGNDNYYFFNREILNKRGIFVGLPEEYKDFTQRFGCSNIPYVKTDTALELAEVINGHPNFVGNGSLAASIAIGLGKNVKYEFFHLACHYIFDRDTFNIF